MKNICNQMSDRTTTNLEQLKQMMDNYVPEVDEDRDTSVLRFSSQTEEIEEEEMDTDLTQKHLDDTREELITLKWNLVRFKQLKQVEKAQARKLMETTGNNEAYNQLDTESDKSDNSDDSFKSPERKLDKL